MADNAAVQVTKEVAKGLILAKLKIPIIIILLLGILAGGILAIFIGLVAFMSSEEEINLGGWEVGEITEFGANEIPAAYIPIYKEAAEKYGVPWNLLAAHHRVETRFSTLEVMISPVGAIGHMQFMPLTWVGWGYGGSRLGNANIPNDVLTNPAIIKKYGGYGTDGNGDGKADPWDLEDAIHSAAKYLAANGAADGNLRKAVFAYNHSEKYVNDVLGFADLYVKGFAAVEAGKAVTVDGVAWPVPGTFTITSRFGTRIDPITGQTATHSGMDIAGPGVNGKPVVSMLDGTVISSGYLGALGNAVIIEHDNALQTSYGHLSAIKARVGQKVKAGQQIGNIGSTGRSTGPHLHFMTRVSGQLVDPEKYLAKFKFKPL